MQDFRPEVEICAVKECSEKDSTRHCAVSLRQHGFLVFVIHRRKNEGLLVLTYTENVLRV